MILQSIAALLVVAVFTLGLTSITKELAGDDFAVVVNSVTAGETSILFASVAARQPL